MSAIIVVIDWLFPVSEDTMDTPWLVHMHGTNFQAVVNAGQFSEGDYAVFISPGSKLPKNPATESIPDQLVKPTTIVGGHDGAEHRIDGILLPFHTVRAYWNVPLDDIHPPPVGTDLSADMKIEKVDLRPDLERQIQPHLNGIPEDACVTIFHIDTPPLLSTLHRFTDEIDGLPVHLLEVRNADATRHKLYATRVLHYSRRLRARETIEILRGWKHDKVNFLWDTTLTTDMKTADTLLKSRIFQQVKGLIFVQCDRLNLEFDFTL
jgi:hypothetical protein